MWMILSIVCVLVRVVFGNPENATPFFAVTRSENESGNDTLENRTKKSIFWMDASTKWSDEPFAIRTDQTGIDADADKSKGDSKRKFKGELDSAGNDERIDSNVGNVAKRREITNSWFDIPSNEDSSEKQKNRWLHWWNDKRWNNEQSTDIRRPIRVPFNSWAGKRKGDSPYSRSNQATDTQTKRNQFTHGRNNHDMPIDGYSVKRMAEIQRTQWKTPFHSWAGKRARNVNDRSMLTVSSSNIDDSSPAGVRFFVTSTTDESPEADGTSKFKDESNMIQGKNEMLEASNADTDVDADVNDRWDGKRDSSPYQISKRKKTSEDKTNWFVQICKLVPAKRVQRNENDFGGWRGKRNMKTYAFRSGDKYLDMPRRSTKEGDIFFPWAG